jgi:crossover junction endodeoxyribonuclease RuvC
MGKPKVILGIDPGTNIMGYGIIEVHVRAPKLVALGVIELKKLNDQYMKLQRIFERTLWLIDEFHPDEVAIEAPFFGKNVQSMLKLGRAQGMAISAALFRSLPIVEYAPRRIKQAITGGGNASKEQVAGVLQRYLGIKKLPANLDATDGLAAAVCHYFQQSLPQNSSSGTKSWKEFISKNPARVKK